MKSKRVIAEITRIGNGRIVTRCPHFNGAIWQLRLEQPTALRCEDLAEMKAVDCKHHYQVKLLRMAQ